MKKKKESRRNIYLALFLVFTCKKYVNNMNICSKKQENILSIKNVVVWRLTRAGKPPKN